LVLGTHRSGTSALTRVINLLGATLPGNLLPPTVDNTTGYWESQDFFELNEALLASAGTDWHDDAPILESWFHSDSAQRLHADAVRLLKESFGDSRLFVLKDPRLCRLVPFWRTVLEEAGVRPSYVLIVRNPQEVALSLAARPRGLGGVTSHEKSHLLWLREVLTAERATRGSQRSIVTYEGLLEDWRTPMAKVATATGARFPVSAAEASPAIDAFLSTGQRHQRRTDDGLVGRATPTGRAYELLEAHADRGVDLDVASLDAIGVARDAVEEAYAPLRDPLRRKLSSHSPWPPEVLAKISERVGDPASAALQVLFISRPPDIPSHVYRVMHQVAALRAAGLAADWVPLDEDAVARSEQADIVVVFRERWRDLLERIHQRCRERGIPVGFGVDDQIFDRSIVGEHFDRLRLMEDEPRAAWLRDVVGGHRRSLVESDFALVSTRPLADATEALGVPGYVLPNGLDEKMITLADAALMGSGAVASSESGRLRLGYASGSMTHQEDFATVASMLCALLDERPQLMLTLVGQLDQSEFPLLERHRDRIETRPIVEHDEVFAELARFDVNLAPLASNPFCESKSVLKYFEAGLVEVPTVAAATLPFCGAIKQGRTGFTADTPDAWRSALLSLVDDPERRARLGRDARLHALAAFGPAAQSAAARHTFQMIAADMGVL